MKLFHLSDLHLGKRVYAFSMLRDQQYVLKQVCALAEKHQPDGILLSGDLYDKPIPPVEAVQLLDEFLTKMQQMGIAVYAISGNHDSAGRVDFGSRILQQQNLHICGAFDGKLYHVSKEDAFGEIHFYLLPFLKPATVSAFREGGESLTYAEAVKWALETMDIDTTKRNVLLAHQFVTWKGTAEESDSETKTLGGVDEMDASLFFDFDYVALGHLHSPQRIGRDTIRYGGSPLKYSFSELRQKKGVTLVEIQEKGNITTEFLPLEPLHPLREIKGTLADLLEAAEEAGAKVEVLKAMGGAANSHLWTQIKSDVTGKTMEVPSSDTATTLGAALLAGVGVGMYESFEEAVEKTVNKGRVHTPNVEHKEIHEKNYETYRALYEQLKSLMKKTGGKKQ